MEDEEDETSSSSSNGIQPTIDVYYQLAKDREIRTIITTIRYSYVDLVCYTLNVVEGFTRLGISLKGLQDSESKTFMEAIERNESKKWLKVVNEEMHSLDKNIN